MAQLSDLVGTTLSYLDGWTPVADTWTYASASTITIPSDGSTVYSKGMCLRFKQGGAYKYFNIRTIAATLITVFINTDYTVANAAITDISYSTSPTPFGFPNAFALPVPTWTTVTTPFTNVPASDDFKYTVLGGNITVVGTAITNATSGGTGGFLATWAAGVIPTPTTYGSSGTAFNPSIGTTFGFCFVYPAGATIRMHKYDGGTLAGNAEQFGFNISYAY